MENERLLTRFGLTGLEARLYIHLHTGGQATGYELAKATGISRSNVYAALASLAEKGGVWLMDGKPACYQAVPVREFCENVIREMESARNRLEEQLPAADREEEGYLTIRGEKHVLDKIRNMILGTRTHIYLSMRETTLAPFLPLLEEQAARGCKVVILSDRPPGQEGITAYQNPEQPDAIRIISDTSAALTGSLTDGPGCSCLYSQKENLVRLLRDSMANEIKLIKITGGITS